MQRSHSIALFIFFATFLAACGGASHASTVPRPAGAVGSVSVHALLPPDTSQLFFVDLASIRRAPFFPVLAESFDAWAESLERVAAAGGSSGPSLADTIGKTEWMLFASAGTPDQLDDLLFVAGRLDDAEARTLFELDASAWGEMPALGALGDMSLEEISLDRQDPERGSIQSRPAWIVGDRAAVEITEGLWLVAPRARIDEVFRRSRTAARVETRTAPMDARLDVFNHHIAASMTGTSELIAAIYEDEEPPGWLRSIGAMGLHLDLSSGVSVGAILVSSGPSAAALVQQELRDGLAGLEDESLVRLMGLGSLLRSIDVRTDRENVTLALRLDERASSLHWGRMSGAVGAALFVVESFATIADDMGELAERLEGESYDYGEEGSDGEWMRQIDLRVTRATPGAPARVGDLCMMVIMGTDGDGTCNAAVSCGDGETFLYGDATAGALSCAQGETPEVVGTDDESSERDGDPALYVNTSDDQFRIEDDRAGQFGAYVLEAFVEDVR